jgi:hypothetical protein
MASILTSVRWNPRRPSAHGASLVSLAITIGIGVAAPVLWPSAAHAARVSGVLNGYGNSTPQQSRDLHFENQVTRDSYLAPTHGDGSFAVELPPGMYELRSERGAVLKRSISVGQVDLSLGQVNELAPYAPTRWFHLQDVAHSILTSPAPSTAYIMTNDPTVLPPNATTIPKPNINWSKPAIETQAAAGLNTTAESSSPMGIVAPQPQPKTDNPDRAGAGTQFYEPPIDSKKPVNPNAAKP